MPEIPAELRGSNDHLWARPDLASSRVRVGVTDFAQQALGDVIDVTLPRPGETVQAGQTCGDIESVKSVSDLIAPVTGLGWMSETVIDPSAWDEQLAVLMEAHAYRSRAGA